MNINDFERLPTYSGINDFSDPSLLRIVERAQVTFGDGAKYLLYVIGTQKAGKNNFDIIHSISERNGRGYKGLKFCPLENVVNYEQLVLKS